MMDSAVGLMLDSEQVGLDVNLTGPGSLVG